LGSGTWNISPSKLKNMDAKPEVFWLYRFLYASVHSERFELSQKAQGLGSAYHSTLSCIVQSIEPVFFALALMFSGRFS